MRISLLLWAFALLFAGACRHTMNRSSGKSLQDVWEQTLVPKTTIEVDTGEAVSLMIDNISKKPTPDSKLSVWTLTLTLEALDSEAACDRKIQSFETRGERGRLTYVQTDHGEGESTYIFAYKLEAPPVAFNEVLITFEKNDKAAKQCRLQLVGDGHWEAEGDIAYGPVSDDPARDKAIREYGSTPAHRLKHYLWHTTRGIWDSMVEELVSVIEFNKGPDAGEGSRGRQASLEKSIEEYKKIGWAPPRYLRRNEAETVLSGAGEDFLFMHHEMLKRVEAELKGKGLAMIPAWTILPKPDDPAFPMGPSGADRSSFSDAKSDLFYWETQKIWETAYQSPTVDIDALAKELLESQKAREKTDDPAQKSEADRLAAATEQVKLLLQPADGIQYKGVKGTTLGEYGHLLEMTIHNNLHTRYAFASTARPNNADPLDRSVWSSDWGPSFDTPQYDWLGDTYSSHVHPWFYRIHGWIDARIHTWLSINGFKSVGKKDECPKLEQPCYVWLSDARYVNKGTDEPWEGPNDGAESGVMQLHAKAHGAKIPRFSDEVIRTTRGLRAQNSSMNRLLMNPKLEKILREKAAK